MLFAAIGVAAYDFFAIARYGRDATISLVLLDVSRDYPIIPCGLGLVAGHVFWPLR